MITLVVLLLIIAGICGCALVESEPEPTRGLVSLPSPPPIPCSCPEEHLRQLIVERAPHVPPCDFAD